jgi:hypothetical protein
VVLRAAAQLLAASLPDHRGRRDYVAASLRFREALQGIFCDDRHKLAYNRTMTVEHAIKIRDLRLRYGAPEVFAANCSCGWLGVEHHGQYAQGAAQLDGARHRGAQQPARALSAKRL